MSHQHYALPFSQENLPSLKLRNAASARYGGDWPSIPHAHSYMELFYVVDGAGEFRIDNELFPVGANQMVIINPNIMHTEVSLGDHPLEYIVVGLEGPELKIHENQDCRFCILSVGEKGGILASMQAILREMQNRKPGYETVCQAYTQILMVQLLRSDSFALVPSQDRASGQFASLRHYMDHHFKEHLTLEDLARVARVNKYHLAHAFCQEYGIPPMRYLTERRIREGQRLLTETDMTLSQISAVLGFSSGSYFSQAFRRVTGQSPMEYRRANR